MRRSALGSMLAVVVLAFAGQASSALAAFPGENGKIAFVRSDQNYLDYRLHLANPDGTGIAGTEVRAGTTADPDWSPDGRRIVLEKFGDLSSFVVTRADGAEVGSLRPGWTMVDNPAWSPDGRQLVYDYLHEFNCGPRFCEAEVGIRRINLDGSEDTLILPTGREPAWSPDGTKIAFSAAGNDGYTDIWVMNADGSGVENLSDDPNPDGAPTWSPDGRRIAFQRTLGSNFNNEVYVMDADGTNQVNITNNPVPEGDAAWSPDGTQIIFTRAGVLYLTDPSGATKTYFSGDGHDGSPDWQPLNPNRPPDCSGVEPTPATLWPNGRKRLVTLSGATDPDGDDVTLRVLGVTHDERGGPGWRPGPAPHQVFLRAKRKRRGDGRVYTISFEARDEHGATCIGETTVTVPQHKNRSRRDR